MIPIDILLIFFLIAAALAISPGPDNLFVLTQAALNGRRAGLLITAGLCTGLIAHTGAVALGVAALFQASPIAFTGLKIVGAGYLLYLAGQAFRSTATAVGPNNNCRLSPVQMYQRGIIMNITNPKVSIFFLAFLPQFTNPTQGALSIQLFILGFVFIIATLLIFGGIALLAGSFGDWLNRSPRSQKLLNRIVGMVFVALALRLLITEH